MSSSACSASLWNSPIFINSQAHDCGNLIGVADPAVLNRASGKFEKEDLAKVSSHCLLFPVLVLLQSGNRPLLSRDVDLGLAAIAPASFCFGISAAADRSLVDIGDHVWPVLIGFNTSLAILARARHTGGIGVDDPILGWASPLPAARIQSFGHMCPKPYLEEPSF